MESVPDIVPFDVPKVGTQVGTHVAGNTISATFFSNFPSENSSEEPTEIQEKGKTTKKRCYMLTINNPTSADVINLWNHDCKYLVFQLEKGIQGTQHIQACIYYENPRAWPKKAFPNAHIEPAKMAVNAIAYCKKEDTRMKEGILADGATFTAPEAGFWEKGEQPEKGRRTDLENVARMISVDKKKLEEVAELEPSYYVRYHKGLQALQSIIQKHRTEMPAVIWLWGKAGVGKTRYPIDKHGIDNCYIKTLKGWWDGYNQQDVIIIDDFTPTDWDFRDLLRLTDRYPYTAQIKGGTVKINSSFIYITCEYHPEQVYRNVDSIGKSTDDKNTLHQLLRRIKHIYEIKPKAEREEIKFPVSEELYV